MRKPCPDRVLDAGLESWQGCQQPQDQNKPDTKNSKQIQYAQLGVLAGQNKIVIVNEFKQGQAQDKPDQHYEHHHYGRPATQSTTSKKLKVTISLSG